jgi:hypothetical protein
VSVKIEQKCNVDYASVNNVTNDDNREENQGSASSEFAYEEDMEDSNEILTKDLVEFTTPKVKPEEEFLNVSAHKSSKDGCWRFEIFKLFWAQNFNYFV